MSPEEIAHLMRHTFLVTLELAAPFLLAALVIGLLVSLVQTLWGIQEVTLSFIPKMLLSGLLIALLFPWMIKIITKYTHTVLITQWDKVVSSVCHAL